jgi:hypothetical protein
MNERDKSKGQRGQKDEGVAGSAQDKPGIGSSQGQDKGNKEPAQGGRSGTADIERDSARSQDSLVNDPTGAYKERP